MRNYLELRRTSAYPKIATEVKCVFTNSYGGLWTFDEFFLEGRSSDSTADWARRCATTEDVDTVQAHQIWLVYQSMGVKASSTSRTSCLTALTGIALQKAKDDSVDHV